MSLLSLTSFPHRTGGARVTSDVREIDTPRWVYLGWTYGPGIKLRASGRSCGIAVRALHGACYWGADSVAPASFDLPTELQEWGLSATLAIQRVILLRICGGGTVCTRIQ